MNYFRYVIITVSIMMLSFVNSPGFCNISISKSKHFYTESNCGPLALSYLLEASGKVLEAKRVKKILPQSKNGFNVSELLQIARINKFNLNAYKLDYSDVETSHMPAIAHFKSKKISSAGHYVILEKSFNEKLLVYDPQIKSRKFYQKEEFLKSWSKVILIHPKNKSSDLAAFKLEFSETSEVFGGNNECSGRGIGSGSNGKNDGPNLNKEPCQKYGSPSWSVNMVNFNLLVEDIPFWYHPTIGPPVEFKLEYNSETFKNSGNVLGTKWGFNYGKFIQVISQDEIAYDYKPYCPCPKCCPFFERPTYKLEGDEYLSPYGSFSKMVKIGENHYHIEFPDGSVHVFNYFNEVEDTIYLTEMRDPHYQADNRLKLTFDYNLDGKLESITDATGRVTIIYYNTSNGLIERVQGPNGRFASFEYNSDNLLSKITDMGGYSSNVTYRLNDYLQGSPGEQHFYLNGIEDSRGKTEIYIEPSDADETNLIYNYPPPGGPMGGHSRITITNHEGDKSEYYYNGKTGKGWYVSPKDYVEFKYGGTNNFSVNVPKIEYAYSSNDQEISEISYPDGSKISYEYDEFGNRIKITDGNDIETNIEYNEMGNPTKIIEAKLDNTLNPIETILEYDLNNHLDLEKITRAEKLLVEMRYNDYHDLIYYKIFNSDGNAIIIDPIIYNTYGQITSYVLKRDSAPDILTEFIYDSETGTYPFQLIEVRTDGLTTSTFTYDAFQRVETVTDTTGKTLSYTYNNLNHPETITYPDGRTEIFTYSSCCPRIIDRVEDRSGASTQYFYNAVKRLIKTINLEQGSNHYVYDLNSNLKEFTDPNGNKTTFDYDTLNRLIKKIYADGNVVGFSYNNVGNIASRTDENSVITRFFYDTNNYIIEIDYLDDTPDVGFKRDAFNRAIEMIDGIGTWNYTYYDNGAIKTIDGPYENDTITYLYDDVGRRTTTSLENGPTLQYQYDPLSRLTAITNNTQTFTYNYDDPLHPASPLIQRVDYPNQTKTYYTYDVLNRLSTLQYKDRNDVVIKGYEYQRNHTDHQLDLISREIITNTDQYSASDEEVIKYENNALNQLMKTREPEKLFTYDPAGNMTKGYTPEGYEFTATYDVEKRLKTIEYTDAGGVTHAREYLYDGYSMLVGIKKYETIAGSTNLVDETRIIRDGFLPIQERDGNNNVIREYTWGMNLGGGIGGLLSMRQDGQDYYFLYDGKGNVATVLDQNEAVVATYQYDEFGVLRSQSGSLDQPFIFSTKRYDKDTGLYLFGYRFYYPAIGKWLTRDPLGEAGGINLYAAMLNNPVNWVDPDGLLTIYGAEGAAGYAGAGGYKNSPSINMVFSTGFNFYTESKEPAFITYGAETDPKATVGLGLGEGRIVGFLTGTIDEFKGKAKNLTVDVSYIGITFTVNDNGKWGFSVAWGGRGKGIGYYMYETNTISLGSIEDNCH